MKSAEQQIKDIASEQSAEQKLKRVETTLAYTQALLRDALRVIDVLVAAGKLKQGHVEEARTLVNSLSND